MMRTLTTEQFMGALFIDMVRHDTYSIQKAELCKLGNRVDKELRKKNDALLPLTSNSVFTVVELYPDIFRVTANSKSIQEGVSIAVNRNNLENYEIAHNLERYFTAGIPKDIGDVVIDVIGEWSRERE